MGEVGEIARCKIVQPDRLRSSSDHSGVFSRVPDRDLTSGRLGGANAPFREPDLLRGVSDRNDSGLDSAEDRPVRRG